MEKRLFILSHDTARRNAVQAVIDAPEGHLVRVEPRTRSLEQNARLHAIFSEAARNHTWQGRKLTPTQWKTLFISGHSVATGKGADMVPGLENEFVNIRESSASMSVARMTSLMEYVEAWMAEHEVAA